MTDFKRRTLTLNSGKQLKLYGNSIAIGNSLEIGEGAAPNIFSVIEQDPAEKVTNESAAGNSEGKVVKAQTGRNPVASVSNPYQLTSDHLMEIADYNIRLWLDFKDNLRKYGTNNPKIFNRDV